MTESQIESKLVTFCRQNGLLTYKFASPAHRGVPDRIIIGKGSVLFLELKRAGQKPTALQDREINLILAHGATATWADSYEQTKIYVTRFFNL